MHNAGNLLMDVKPYSQSFFYIKPLMIPKCWLYRLKKFEMIIGHPSTSKSIESRIN